MESNKFNFTKAAIDSLPPPEKGKRAYYYDSKMRGLGISVTSAGTKSFIVYRWVNGKPERITLARYPDMSIEQARGKAAEINAAFANGENPADKKRLIRAEATLSELFSEYLERHAKPNKKTWAEDERQFKQYLTSNEHGMKLADRKLSAIKKADIAALHSKIGKRHKATANKVLALASSIFSWAIRSGLWDQPNPAQGIQKAKEKSRDRFLQSDELPRFLQAVAEEPNETIRDYVLISLLTGARRSNVQAMRWDEISFERAEWRIPETKNGLPQTVPLIPEVIQILEARKPAGPAEFVFSGPGRTGHLMEPKNGWKRILERAGLSDLRIHDLRRTFGSWMASSGASTLVTAKAMGHQTLSMALIYQRLSNDPIRKAMQDAATAMLTGVSNLPDQNSGDT